MIPLLGRSLILLSLLVSTVGAMAGFATGARRSAQGWAVTRRCAYLYAALIAAANGLMIYALLARDFSVSYVAEVGSRSVPDWVAIVSLWSSLDGSILFWGLVLGAYVAAATWTYRASHDEVMPWAAGIWLSCAAFFSFLVSGPAQPFRSMLEVPVDGPGPNPLLQNHILMAFHPPFLYLGYVGMTIPFGLAGAALLARRLGADLLRPLRTWLLLPWIFQTVAVVLGGWWAYEVLGWGGVWAWDPVENASLLPWLTATAALHSAMLSRRKGILKGWTVTLVMATFLLTILGTFLTRSGVVNSVHAFTQSAIGPTLLVFLAAGLVWSVALLTMRVDALAPERTMEGVRSRDGAFLVNNLLLVLLTFTVLLGTVFPLLVDALRGVQMSVGRPYFDTMVVPLGVTLLLLMGVGPALPWGRATPAQLRRALLSPLLGLAVVLTLGLALGVRSGWTLAALACGGYAAQVTLQELLLPVRERMRAHGESLFVALWSGLLRRRRLGAYMVHAGIIIIMVALAVSGSMSTSAELTLPIGGQGRIGVYTLTFVGTEERGEPHRQSTLVRIAVRAGSRDLGELAPRMNQYETRSEPIGTPAVRTSWREDLYLSLGSLSPDGRSVSLHAIVNPMIGWIWLATAIIALGGFLALVSGRTAGGGTGAAR